MASRRFVRASNAARVAPHGPALSPGCIPNAALAPDIQAREVSCASLVGLVGPGGNWLGPPGGRRGPEGDTVVLPGAFGDFRALTAAEAGADATLRREGACFYNTDAGRLMVFAGDAFKLVGAMP